MTKDEVLRLIGEQAVRIRELEQQVALLERVLQQQQAKLNEIEKPTGHA